MGKIKKIFSLIINEGRGYKYSKKIIKKIGFSYPLPWGYDYRATDGIINKVFKMKNK